MRQQSAEAHYNRGVKQGDLQHLEEALEAYEQAIQMDPKIAVAHVNRGDVLSELQRPEEALDAFEQARKLDANE